MIASGVLFSYMKYHGIPTNGSEHIANNLSFKKSCSVEGLFDLVTFLH